MNNKNLELSDNKIRLYETETGSISVEVKMEKDTLWLTQKQMSELLECSIFNINIHLKNIYDSAELQESSTIEESSIVQMEGDRAVKRKILFYNLDVVIAVAYRVNSKKGTQFRKWATSILNEYLVKGYSVNEKKISKEKLQELQDTIHFLSKSLQSQASFENNSKKILELIHEYTKTWSTLLEYDENRIFSEKNSAQAGLFELTYTDATQAIQELKKDLLQKGEASDLFGRLREDGLKSILENISQTFDSVPLYISNVERAACLHYFIVKNHPFVDGNKRIGALLFMLFLKRSEIDTKNISQSSLTAITLLVAISDPKEKDLMVKLVMKLINL